MSTESFTKTRQATNALFKLDDFPAGEGRWLQSRSNLLTDLVQGASIRLNDVGTTNLTITNDDQDMADKVQAFIDEYNALLDYIDEITRVVLDTEGRADIDAAGILTGNYAVNMLRSALRSFIGTRAIGFDADHDIFSLLTQVGVSSNDNRRIDFDREHFRNELNRNPDAMIKLFTADSYGELDTNDFIYRPFRDTIQTGRHSFEVTYDADGYLSEVWYTDSNGQRFSTTNGGIALSEDGLTFTIMQGGARGAAFEGIGQNLADQTHTFTLTVKDGKSKTFEAELNRLFDEETGLTNVLVRNYENIIRNIDRRIDHENRRVLQVKRRLEMRFARLEVNMSNWNAQMERLQQQIMSLPRGV
jgi:flagellar hook-associated protein 2